MTGKTSVQQGPLVLVVDDDAPTRESFASCLEDNGYRVIALADGSDALRYLCGNDDLPEVILLDLSMPIMAGQEFREVQLGYQRLSGIPVVVISGVPHLEQHASQLKAAAHLPKPVGYDSLLEVIQKCIKKPVSLSIVK